MNQRQRLPFSALLLAGGKSTRMGRDKALIDAGGITLWRRQLSILQALKPAHVFVSAALRVQLSDRNVSPVDDLTPGAGPLAGIAAGLRNSVTPLLVVLAVDLPRMSAVFLTELLARADRDRGVVPRVQTHLEPLAAVYPTGSLPRAGHCLEQGVLKVQTFAELAIADGMMDVYPVAPGQEPLFFNLNTPFDLATFEGTAVP